MAPPNEDREGLIARLEQLRLFLNGEIELEGIGFGDRPTGKPAFWWRRYLTRLSDAETGLSSLLEELRRWKTICEEGVTAGRETDAIWRANLEQARLERDGFERRAQAAESRALKAEEQRKALMEAVNEALAALRDVVRFARIPAPLSGQRYTTIPPSIVRMAGGAADRLAAALSEDADQPLLKTEGEGA